MIRHTNGAKVNMVWNNVYRNILDQISHPFRGELDYQPLKSMETPNKIFRVQQKIIIQREHFSLPFSNTSMDIIITFNQISIHMSFAA